jgi:hypothetical protein
MSPLSIEPAPSPRPPPATRLAVVLGLSLTLWLGLGWSLGTAARLPGSMDGVTGVAAGGETPSDFALQEPCTITVTNAADDGPGSLRRAIADVCDDGGRITFAADTTIYLTSTLEISQRLTIDGGVYTVTVSGDSGGDGTPDVQPFFIESSGVVTLTHLNIISGMGGGIYNFQGTLTVQNSTLSGNDSFMGPGGIHNYRGALTVLTSTLSNNSTDFGGAGGIANSWGTVTVIDSTFSGNEASVSGGGAILNTGPMTVTHSTFSGNSGLNGGGILHMVDVLTVTNSTFSGNRASKEGGAIDNEATMIVRNSTFSDNSADFRGGAIANLNQATLTVQNSTFYGNSADYGGGIYNANADTLYEASTLRLFNTLIAHTSRGGDCHGNVATSDHNLMQSTLAADTCGLSDNPGNSRFGVDPLLGPLTGDGGPPAHALLPGSPAIDAGNNATCLATDQRGIARPQGAACDIGAVEAQASQWGIPIAPFVVLILIGGLGLLALKFISRRSSGL